MPRCPECGSPHSEKGLAIHVGMKHRPRRPTPSTVTRFEVIDYRSVGPGPARAFVAYGCSVALAYQDDGRTLKVFLGDEAAQGQPAINEVAVLREALNEAARTAHSYGLVRHHWKRPDGTFADEAVPFEECLDRECIEWRSLAAAP